MFDSPGSLYIARSCDSFNVLVEKSNFLREKGIDVEVLSREGLLFFF